MNNDKLNKWLKWLPIIQEEISMLIWAKNIFYEVQVIFKNNNNLPKQPFYQYLGITYTSYMVAGLRRQIKSNEKDDSISLIKLLNEIIENPQIITKEYFINLYKYSEVAFMAESDFHKNFNQDKTSQFIDTEIVKSHLEELKSVTKKCTMFSDKRVAHYDKNLPKELPTYDELDNCINLLEKIYVHYLLLFKAESWATLLATPQYDWKEIFYMPWILKEE